MFQSPSDDITMEFQGGETLLAFDLIVYAVEKAKAINEKHKKRITFVICTNLSKMSFEILAFCKEHDILISTSYDGPAYIHNLNRPKTGAKSHDLVLKGIEMSREVLGHDRVSALMTTTNLTLDYPIEIIDDYLEKGFGSIFLRPISPYGFALRNEKKNHYETERYLAFYKKGLDYIISLNKKGVYFVEEYARIILSKILTPFPVGYVDLQSPAGLINSVIVYNYDGYVYATDEARMLAENGDLTFQLGHVALNTYQEIFYGTKAQSFAQTWANESLPGCSECGFQQYCGADPVHNHATQKDFIGYRPTSSYCQKNMEIIRYIFSLLLDETSGVERIFRSWVNKKPIVIND
jgi:His-Xaa-Ser system radical SAM maturase HxsB